MVQLRVASFLCDTLSPSQSLWAVVKLRQASCRSGKSIGIQAQCILSGVIQVPCAVLMCHLVAAAKELVRNLNRGVKDPNFAISADYMDAAFMRKVGTDGGLRRAIVAGRHATVFHYTDSSIDKGARLFDSLEPVRMGIVVDEVDALFTTAGSSRRATKREVAFESLRRRDYVSGLTLISATHFGTLAWVMATGVSIGLTTAVEDRLRSLDYRCENVYGKNSRNGDVQTPDDAFLLVAHNLTDVSLVQPVPYIARSVAGVSRTCSGCWERTAPP